ncbi:hypothetical protein BD410DRAFT_828342 [Rickenella mellea]|uniref:Uncharacterized protein n=1 Tax=Rickenella mellea TaxID=50990 RepID=A0A4Y7Q5Y3_9AGAM|nr:hypothetical protein BD410DRAFT_828342 [Rickenella mellea]
MTGSRIDTTTIDNLIGFLTRIKANGGIVDEVLLDATKDVLDGHEERLAVLKHLVMCKAGQGRVFVGRARAYQGRALLAVLPKPSRKAGQVSESYKIRNSGSSAIPVVSPSAHVELASMGSLRKLMSYKIFPRSIPGFGGPRPKARLVQNRCPCPKPNKALTRAGQGKACMGRASRNAQQLILKVTENKIYRLQKETSAATLQRGIQSLPDDLVRVVFEAGFHLYELEHDCDSYPMTLSHVNRRWRTIAMDTPRVWSRLSNVLEVDELRWYIEMSRSAALTIRLELGLFVEEDGYPCSIPDFLYITTAHSSRWQSFTCYIRMPEWGQEEMLGKSYWPLHDYINIDLSHLTNFSLQIW